MAHLVFNSPYEFYALPEPERIKLIGRVFKERVFVVKGKGKKLVYTDQVRDTLYFPIGLAPDAFNYGIQQGVIFVNPVQNHREAGKWFRVGAFSPDDLDVDLNFGAEHIHLRQDIIAFIRGPMHKQNRHYKEVMEQIRDHFKAGTIWT